MAGYGEKTGLVGVGGVGCHIVAQALKRSTIPHVALLIDRDARSLAEYPETMRFLIGQETRPKPFCSATPQWCGRALLDNAEEIGRRVSGSDTIVMVAGLGGATSSGAMPALASLFSSLGIYTAAVVTSPFQFEGKQRERQAQTALADLYQSTDRTIEIPDNALLDMVSHHDTTLGECFSLLDKILVFSIQRNLERMAREEPR